MAKIDAYLKSIERFGASGAILSSGQPVTLRFPQGDRQATQTTSHEQLVGMVREVAPPAALDQIDKNRIAKFDLDSSGTRYSINVSPKPGIWQVAIESAPAATVQIPRQQPRAASAPIATITDDMAIERGQYAEVTAATARAGVLDQWTSAARSARATDVLLATGAPPVMRVGGELQPLGDRGPLDADTISRELGVVAPPAARATWNEGGVTTFTYGDGVGRVRATLTRDHRGPGATLRLLVGEPPAIERLAMPREVGAWLEQRGLVVVAGSSGSGKTTTHAALVRALADKNKRVITIEDPIEIVQASPWVSQRAIGEHVPSVAAGVASALREGADAIVIGNLAGAEAAVATLDALAGGQLVLATMTTDPRYVLDELVELAGQRERARALLGRTLVGTISPVVKGGSRSFEVLTGRSG